MTISINDDGSLCFEPDDPYEAKLMRAWYATIPNRHSGVTFEANRRYAILTVFSGREESSDG